jgi:integrase
MASVKKRPDGMWRARFRDPDGRERARHFARKVDATRWLATVEADKLRGVYVDPSDATTLGEYARRWAAARPHRATTAARVRAQVDQLAASPLGGRRLAAVRPSDVQTWASSLSARMAPATVAQHVKLLRSIFAAAVLDRLVGSSPVQRIALPRADRPRLVPLTIDQVRLIADEVPKRCKAMVVTQAGCGLRLGELLALRAEDVNFLGRTVRVQDQLAVGTLARVEPKTPRSRRTIPLPTTVAEVLAEHMRQFPPAVDGSLFYGPRSGRPIAHPTYTARILAPAVARLVPAVPVGTSSHDLRHHYASVLLAAGESVVAVAERLGHDDATMVLRVYGHLLPDLEEPYAEGH